MRLWLVVCLALGACGSSEPDAVSKLIAAQYAYCLPDLEASDIERVDAGRYVSDEISVAWTVKRDYPREGDTFVVPAPESMEPMQRMGCAL